MDGVDLANKKISVGGTMVSGMAGTETVHGPAVVGGDNVTYNQAVAKPVVQQKLAQNLAQAGPTVDGVAYGGLED